MVARPNLPAGEDYLYDCEARGSPSRETPARDASPSATAVRENPREDASDDDEEYLSQLPARVHHTLMRNFWTYYNCELQSIHRPVFELGWRTNSPDTYSAFLHLCILGIGLRYSDVTDEYGASFFLPSSNESIFHQRAFHTAKTVIESEPRTCLIQGLLLFGDLEFGIGRNNNGVMHACKSYLSEMPIVATKVRKDLGCQLALQSKMHLRPPNHMDLDQVQNRAMCVWTCAMYDR